MQNVMQIATNTGHTAQNTLNVCQGPKVGLEETLVSRNDF